MKKILLLLCLGLPALLHAQTESPSPTKVNEVFYGTRLINSHTTEQVGKRVLAYRISHRFGSLRSDVLYNFLGFDGGASISFQFDYGLSDKLGIGIARDGVGKLYNGYLKYSLLSQMQGGGSPVSVTLYGKGNIGTLRNLPAAPGLPGPYDNFAHRMSYVSQALISRKFGEKLTLQIAPTWVHQNLVERAVDKNDIFAIHAGAEFKVSKRFGISGEYNYVLNEHTSQETFNSAGIGVNFVTGGHIFQIHLVNSRGINEATAIPYTTSDWLDGDFRIGFNISRSFWR
jgi:Membrane bound beta barrel domain (DUF5777)